MIHVPTYGSGGTIRVNGAVVETTGEKDGFSLIGTYGPGNYLVEGPPYNNLQRRR